MRKLNSRTFHRYLSLIIGIQLLLWTLSGLVFSWNSIKKVRGENFSNQPQTVNLAEFRFVEIDRLLSTASEHLAADFKPTRVELRSILNNKDFKKPV